MRLREQPIVALAAVALALGACGASSTTGDQSMASAAATTSTADWPEFGLDARRSSAAADGIAAADVGRLHRGTVTLPGTVDSSPIYLHAVTVAGGVHDVFVVTTTYGRALAVDAGSGQLLWSFAPPGIAAYEGSYRITNASPVADPDRRFVYSTSPDGLIHKLALTDGREQPGWPASVTRDPSREKLAGSLNVAGAAVIAVTGGYVGDTPPYQGHVVSIARSTGRRLHIFNSLCAGRRRLIVPSTCAARDSAIWARAGAVVEPGGRRLLVATGNGPYDGRGNFGDSVLELDTRNLHLRQAYTPTEQATLNANDTDLGSSAPALLPGGLAVIGGKDGVLRLLDLARLNGRAAARPLRTGGELQRIATPGPAGLFSAPAVSGRTVLVADGGGTAAYALRGRRLHLLWSTAGHGSSPVVAGRLLWVYDVDAGQLDVYLLATGRLLARLAAGPGHWNSPVVAGGRVALPEGNANDHRTSGILDIWS
ncbi:MAG: PQQ-binding-like beta-propeller repeat protein [Solirubrobacteraceae bacterium]